MDSSMLIAMIVSFIMGTFSYIIVQFWIRPIKAYKKIKLAVSEALNTYEKDPQSMDSDALRKYSVNLSDSYVVDLPHWYRIVLANRKEWPVEASKDLMTLSNTRESDHGFKRVESIRTALQL